MDHLHANPHGAGLRRSWTKPASFVGLRVVPWRGDVRVALVGPRRDGRRPSTLDIVQCLGELAERGVGQAITPALGQMDAQPFFDAGFRLHEHLHLLAHRLSDEVPPSRHQLSPGRPWHRSAVLRVDAQAFEPFWQFDRLSLREARHATPTSRFRVAFDGRDLVGYAVTGRAGDRGYLQRLAVAPAAAGRGLGTDLVLDGFRWLRKRGVHTVMVNTQEHNHRALDLYEHLGFERQDPGLVVLRWDAAA
ncbi:MAG: GNAT family N-acetyltransferase [Acidimicrobiales bacterium]